MVDPKENKNQELIEALKTEEETEEVVKSDDGLFGYKMKKLLILLGLIIVLLFIILWLLSLKSSPKENGYSKYESEMVSAAKEYYKINKDRLPQADKQTNEVALSELIKLKYMEDHSAIKSCNGSVTVENNSNSYSYVAYLDCGEKYSSKLLYKKIISNTVTTGAGLYNINNEYIYRGEIVNNYVKFGEKLWRIVKIDANNDIVLVLNDFFEYTRPWDNRYNMDTKYNSGYNDYEKSRIKEFLDSVASSSSDTNDKLLSKNDMKKLVSYKLCIGKADINQNVNNNTYECQKVLEKKKIGLLTLSDYMTASIDPNCTSPASNTCQNYNYLVDFDNGWWLATGNSANSYETYRVDSSGMIESLNASSYTATRPVIHLSKNITYKSGKGTEKKPYIIG